MLRTNSKKAIENIRAYIMRNYDGENYGYETPSTFTETAKIIMQTFHKEYVKHNCYKGRKPYQTLFEEWSSGLPSILDTCYYYNRSAVSDVASILEETEEESAKYTEADAEKLLTWLIYRELCKVTNYPFMD